MTQLEFLFVFSFHALINGHSFLCCILVIVTNLTLLVWLIILPLKKYKKRLNLITMDFFLQQRPSK